MKYDFEPVPLNYLEPPDAEQMLIRAESYYELMAQRRTVRHFSDKPVSRAVIEACIRAAGSAPSGANHQPWHFACVSDLDIKRKIRIAAEEEERAFYAGRAGDQWLDDLHGLGTDAQKPFLETAPWLIAIFAERYGFDGSGEKQKNYYVPESVGIATGLLINALHNIGLATLTHTPNPMKFLSKLLGRPSNERPMILLVVGHPAPDAKVPKAATVKKPLQQISSFFE
jgi:iodotyrosine deiodinase